MLVLLAWGVCVWATGAWAQLGGSVGDCERMWGRAAVTASNESGQIQTLYFSNATVQVEVMFVGGRAQRLVYARPPLAVEDIQSVLRDNGEGQGWTVWVPAGRSEDPGMPHHWQRSDEMAMAELSDTAMTVLGAEWNRAQQQAAEAVAGGTPADPKKDGVGEASTSRPLVEPAVVTVVAPPAAEPRPPRPERMPARGTLREDVVRMLGPAKGSVRRSQTEVLAYPWGCVIVVDGKVSAIE